ncbi:MAG: hypothetical protein LBQ18_04100 [Campylobacteraceae bacterium]|jgi:cytoskeletal protein RodZ|nr:hypothetical protein [Campylobacteraceae bacterium]
MDSIKALEKIGLREVSRKTYIELSYLKLMADRDFGKLHRIKTLGFVKIIKREYGLDMSDWVEEFEAYLQEKSQVPEEKIEAPLPTEKWYDKFSLYTDNQKRIYVVVAVLFLICITAVFYTLLKGRTAHIEDTSAYSNIVIADSSLQIVDTVNETQEPAKPTEENKTIQVETPQQIEAAPVVTPTQNVVQRPVVVSEPKQATAATGDVFISPNIAIWVGIIDLATFSRSTYLQEGDIKIDAKKEQIIITGHGDFRLKVDGEITKSFNPGSMVYLYVRDGIIKQISEDEFVRLNRGIVW